MKMIKILNFFIFTFNFIKLILSLSINLFCIITDLIIYFPLKFDIEVAKDILNIPLCDVFSIILLI